MYKTIDMVLLSALSAIVGALIVTLLGHIRWVIHVERLKRLSETDFKRFVDKEFERDSVSEESTPVAK